MKQKEPLKNHYNSQDGMMLARLVVQQKNDKFLEHLGDTNDETCGSVWLGVERERD